MRSQTIFVQDEYGSVKAGFEKLEKTTPNSNQPGLVSRVLQVSSMDFIRKITVLTQGTEIFYYYISPDASLRFLTVGEIFHTGLSATTFRTVRKDFFDSHVVIDESGRAEFPLFFLQKMFNKADATEWSDFEDSVFIPEIVFLQDATGNYIIHNCYTSGNPNNSLQTLKNVYKSIAANTGNAKFEPVLQDAPKDKARWGNSISETKQQITEGTIQKVVLSRHMQYSCNTQPDYAAVANNLEKQTSAYRFAFQRGNSFVAGASPEKLFALSGNTIYSEAIAGSAKRGKSEEEDINNAAELMNSAKERFEHDCVVQFIASALSKYSSNVKFSTAPEIKRLLRIMHLRTEIQAEVMPNINLDDVISDLYPTPATCGEPKEIAYSLINRLETHSRGLYCGLSGWLTNKQNGNFYILMRLALLKNIHMHVYAGCGIVKDSDADREVEESQYKAESIIRLFYNEN